MSPFDGIRCNSVSVARGLLENESGPVTVNGVLVPAPTGGVCELVMGGRQNVGRVVEVDPFIFPWKLQVGEADLMPMGRMGGKLTTRRHISCRNSLHKPEGYHLELCVSGAACGIRPLPTLLQFCLHSGFRTGD